MINDIKKAIIELEKKNYKIEQILLNDDIIKILENNFNNFYGESVIKLTGINTLFGYEVCRNLFDNTPVVYRVSIRHQDLFKDSDKYE